MYVLHVIASAIVGAARFSSPALAVSPNPARRCPPHRAAPDAQRPSRSPSASSLRSPPIPPSPPLPPVPPASGARRQRRCLSSGPAPPPGPISGDSARLPSWPRPLALDTTRPTRPAPPTLPAMPSSALDSTREPDQPASPDPTREPARRPRTPRPINPTPPRSPPARSARRGLLRAIRHAARSCVVRVRERACGSEREPPLRLRLEPPPRPATGPAHNPRARPVIARRAAVRPVPVRPVPVVRRPDARSSPRPTTRCTRALREDGVIVGVDWGGAPLLPADGCGWAIEPSPARPRIRQNPLTPRRLPRYPRHEAPPVTEPDAPAASQPVRSAADEPRRQPVHSSLLGRRRSAPQAPPQLRALHA